MPHWDQLARAVRHAASCVLVVAAVGCRATTGEAVRPEDDPKAVTAPPSDGPAKKLGKTPPPNSAPLPANVERWAALTRELGEGIRRSGGACPRVAAEVQAFVARYRKDLAALERARQAWEETAQKGAVANFYHSVRRDLDSRIDAGIQCSSDPAARQAFDAFFVASGLDTRR